MGSNERRWIQFWWSKRLQASFELFDVVRIDHFRGFSAYWEIPAEAENATIGKWVKGPGYDLFKAVKEQPGELPIIAEDLGFMDEDVINLREAYWIPRNENLGIRLMGEDPKVEIYLIIIPSMRLPIQERTIMIHSIRVV